MLFCALIIDFHMVPWSLGRFFKSPKGTRKSPNTFLCVAYAFLYIIGGFLFCFVFCCCFCFGGFFLVNYSIKEI